MCSSTSGRRGAASPVITALAGAGAAAGVNWNQLRFGHRSWCLGFSFSDHTCWRCWLQHCRLGLCRLLPFRSSSCCWSFRRRCHHRCGSCLCWRTPFAHHFFLRCLWLVRCSFHRRTDFVLVCCCRCRWAFWCHVFEQHKLLLCQHVTRVDLLKKPNTIPGGLPCQRLGFSCLYLRLRLCFRNGPGFSRAAISREAGAMIPQHSQSCSCLRWWLLESCLSTCSV